MTTPTEKQIQGSRSYRQGRDFEEKVADLYRLLHYEVEHSRLFSGRQVDLFLKTRIGDLELIRAVECKSGPVGADEIDSFHAKLILVRKDYPSAIGSIVSASTFTDAVKSHAAAIGIHLILFRDLSSQLFNGHSYATNLMRDLSTNERYPMENYIEPFIGYDMHGVGELAKQVVSEWLENPHWKQITILGDVGTGKSFLSRVAAFELAKGFLSDPLNKPLPILIDLRNADRQFSLEGLILTHLATSGLPQVSFDVFQYALSQGQLVVILDGFDEMASRVTPQVTTRNFHELARCVQGQAKIMLTCRTHYFKSRTEEEDVILGGSAESQSENVRELYWDLISRKGFKIAYLRPFVTQQIEQYVKRVKPTATREAMAKIHQTYNLMELSQRPMLLEMIVKSIDKLGDSEINQATLYKVFTSAWIHRDQWRDVLTSDDKMNFLTGLAQKLWQEDVDVIHYRSLIECIRSDLAARITNQQELVEVDNEIRTASFLTRNDLGFYGFAHKSYQEYFYALFLAEELKKHRFECFYTRRLSSEIVSFLGYMIEGDREIETALEEIVTSSYRPMISENALVTLYGIRRSALLSTPDIGSGLIVPFPDRCDLMGAQLEQVILEGISLRQANLRNTNLTEAVLSHGDLSGCDLTDAALVRTNLIGSRLGSADMTRCMLREANLEGADISRAIITGGDLTDAQLIGLTYAGVDFSGVTLAGAILPDDLANAITTRNFDALKKVVTVDNALQLDSVWKKVTLARPALIRVARHYALGSNTEAEDIVDDSILLLMRDKQTIDRISTLDAPSLGRYLHGVIRNVASQAVRSREKAFSLSRLQDEGEADLLGVEWHPEVSQEYAVIKEYLDTATDRDIPADQKVFLSEIAEMISKEFSAPSVEIFKLFFLEGMDVSEIALDLGRSRTFVTKLVRRMQDKIREYLAE